MSKPNVSQLLSGSLDIKTIRREVDYVVTMLAFNAGFHHAYGTSPCFEGDSEGKLLGWSLYRPRLGSDLALDFYVIEPGKPIKMVAHVLASLNGLLDEDVQIMHGALNVLFDGVLDTYPQLMPRLQDITDGIPAQYTRSAMS